MKLYDEIPTHILADSAVLKTWEPTNKVAATFWWNNIMFLAK